MDERFALVATAAARQLGLVTTAQAREAGFTPDQIDGLVAGRQWSRVRPGVLAMNGAPRTWPQRVLAETLSAGPEAVASHRTAAALWMLDGFETPGTVELSLPRGRRPRPRRGLRIHVVRDFDLIRPTRRQGVPVTDVNRTILDLCATGDASLALRAFDDARYQRLTTLAALRTCHDRHTGRGRPGVRALRRLLERRGGGRGPENAFEAKVLDLLVAAGLPRPECGVEVTAAGRRYRLDLAYPPPIRVALECDGRRAHLTERAFEDDRVRENALKLDGWLVLRFTWSRLTDHPDAIVADVRRALEARQ